MIQSSTLDKFGIILSGVCLVHCLLTPILITIIPILSINLMVEDLLFHQLMLGLVLPTSCVALIIGCRKHKQLAIILTGVIGMAILTAVALFGHELFGEGTEKLMTTAGGLILAASHYFNFRACQSVPCKDSNCSTQHHH